MKLIFDRDKHTGEVYAVDTETLREYKITEAEFRAKKLSDKDPDGNPRWKKWWK